MPLTKQEFTELMLTGVLCYFISDKIQSAEPHFHVVVSEVDNQSVFMLCGTSKPESTTRFLELNDIDYCTFVSTEPNADNELSKTTYFHCNQPYNHSIDDLFHLYNSGTLRMRGKIAEHELLNVKNGIEASPLVEEDDKTSMLAGFPDFGI